MNEQSVRIAFRSDLLRLLTPLAALAAMASFAAREIDPAGSAESLYLALLATAVLLPVGFLAPWPAFELGLGSALATAVAWGLSPGPGRGAAMAVVLLGTLAVAAGRALSPGNPRQEQQGLQGQQRPEEAQKRSFRISAVPVVSAVPGVPVSSFLPLALGLQILMRGDMLFAPASMPAILRTAVALVALPAVAGIALSMLARRHGTALALIAGGTALLPAPGLNVSSTLALVALAAGDFLAWEGTGRIAKGIAALALLAPIAWAPGPGIAMAVCGLALWRPWIGLGLAVPAAIGLVWLSPAPWTAAPLQAVWLPLLAPAVLVPRRDRIASAAAAVLMTAAIPLVPNVATLAAPMALAVLSMRRDAAFAVSQAVWTGALAASTALLAGYPWLREEPLSTALGRLGRPPGPALAAWVAGLFLALAGLGIWMGRNWSGPVRCARLAGMAAACLTLALLLGLPHAGTALLAPEMPVVLDAGHPVWEGRVPGPAVGSVVVESSLSNGAGLALGTPVAIVRLRNAAGRNLDWTLRAGEATGEWAVRRPDVARAGVTAPRPWISWIAGDFLAQRYRARWTLERPERATVLRLERAPGVPPDLVVAVYQVEIRR